MYAEFSIELTFERVFNIDQGLDVGPAQLSTQCVEFLFICKSLRTAETMSKLLVAPAFTIGQCQLVRKLMNCLFTLFSPLHLQDFGLDPFTYSPVKNAKLGIDGTRQSLTGSIDQSRDVLKQAVIDSLKNFHYHSLELSPQRGDNYNLLLCCALVSYQPDPSGE